MWRRALLGVLALAVLLFAANSWVWYQVRQEANHLALTSELAFLPVSIGWTAPVTLVVAYRLNPDGYAVPFTWRTHPWGEIRHD